MPFKIYSPISFNQSWKYEDMKRGGNCSAYAVIVSWYIGLQYLQDPAASIDYTNLKKVLNGFNCAIKNDISENYMRFVDDYVDTKPGFDDEFAIFNDNQHLLKTRITLSEYSQSLFNAIKQFKMPFFSFLTFWDDKQSLGGIELNHVVLFYVTSPNEIHFFDSISGLHLISLPDSFTEKDLAENVIELLFKRNLLCKWFMKPDSPTLFCNYANSYMQDVQLDDDKRNVKEFFQAFMRDQRLTYDLSFAKKFVERNMAVISLQNSKQHELVSMPKILIGAGLFLALYYQTQDAMFSGSVTLSTLVGIFCMSKIADNLEQKHHLKNNLPTRSFKSL